MDVVPATIWFNDGKIKIGASHDDLDYLAKSKDIVKTNLSNLAIVLSNKKTGAATVSASLCAASAAGISVFATGGIGGVHRGFEKSFDISSDLYALSQFPLIVVSAGVKSILHIEATVEHLETLGIPIIGYKTNTFPGFYYRDTGLQVDISAEDPGEIADIYIHQKTVFKNKALLVVSPCPEDKAIPREIVDKAISEAEKEMLENSSLKEFSSRRDYTPYMLKRLTEITNNKTLSANLALIKNNVSVGGKISLVLKNKI